MPIDFAAARATMIDSQVRTNDVPDIALQAAMSAAPREVFCPGERGYLAYAETEIEYAPGYWLMTPRDVAKLLYAATPRAGETALCLAAPYAALVLARLGAKVTLQLPEGPALSAVKSALAGEAVAVVGGALESPACSGFDLVVVEGAVKSAPQAWIDALAPGGRLALVERDGPVGKAFVWVKSPDGAVGRRAVFDATPHVLPGFSPAPTFAF